MRINLIYNNNLAGTPRTAQIITESLAGIGADVTHSPLSPGRPGERVWVWAGRAVGRPRFDLNISLEQVCPDWFGYARRNLLVPNQEWFEPSWIRYLGKFDLLLCKTRDAERRFAELGARVRYVGFSSRDQRLTGGSSFSSAVLHLAGRSRQKGTEVLLRVWQRHPEWPSLTVVQRRQRPEHQLWHPRLPNVTYYNEYLPDARIRELQNSHWLHVGPSMAEGFGHWFAEGMSCGAVVVTSDAPPMNESIQPDRGFLVAAAQSRPQGVAMLYQVNESALEETLARALALPLAERERLGRNARDWFERNQVAFNRQFTETILGAA